MQSRLIFLFLGIFFLGTCATTFAQRALMVVRHAEKVDDSDDSPLTEEGEQRAQALARLLKNSGITAIYTTQFQRTIKTIEPLSEILKMQPIAVHQDDLEGLYRKIRSNPDGIVLVAGHRGTVPKILKSFGCREDVSLYYNEFDSLFILTLSTKGAPVLLHLRYGKPAEGNPLPQERR